jgi:hypothetical protein
MIYEIRYNEVTKGFEVYGIASGKFYRVFDSEIDAELWIDEAIEKAGE